MGDTHGIELGTVVAGRYRVEERLGEGGMGSVYRVEHVHTGQPLALKVLNPKLVENTVALERFRREARAPARINSDHVVKVTDADVAPEIGGAPFLVMELLEGETFEGLLKRRGSLSPNEALGLLRQIARALEKAHALGIVHRDIKPENLFLTRREDGSDHVKLLDFGIAKLGEGAGEGAASKTATGEVFGTPLYMSPEQTLGRTDLISPQTDVWALALIAHKLLTGREPWTAETLPHLIAQIAYEPLPVPSSQGAPFGPAYDAWFARACARQPGDRHETASEAVSALADALGIAEPALSSNPSFPRVAAASSGRDHDAFAETAHASGIEASPGRSMSDTLAAQVAPKKRTPQLVYLAAFGVAAAIGVVLWFTLRGPSPNPEPNPSLAASIPTAAIPADPSESESVPAPPPPPSASAPEVAPAVSEAAPAPAPGPTRRMPAIAGPKPAPAPPPPSVATPAPAPTPSTPRDPLGARH
jgi:eukaryotic-like serine/threonine-protein kinase